MVNEASILNLGGEQSVESVVSSHLGSGSPSTAGDVHESKRSKYSNESVASETLHLWAVLEEDVKTVLRAGKIERPYSSIYNDVQRLCSSKYTEQGRLSHFIYNELDTVLSSEVLPTISECLSQGNDQTYVMTAKKYLSILHVWESQLQLLSRLFLYLDRSYHWRHPRKLCIQEYGLKQLVELSMVKHNSELHTADIDDPVCRLVEMLLRAMRRDRSDNELQHIAREMVLTLERLGKWSELNVNSSLSRLIVEDYDDLQKTWLADKSTYVISLLDALSFEVNFLLSCKKSSIFAQNITSQLKWKYLMRDLNSYLTPSFETLVKPENLDHLKALKRFCDNSMDDYSVDSYKILIYIWGKFVCAKMEDLATEADLISSIIAKWNMFMEICRLGFEDEAFEFEVRSAMSKVMASKDMLVRTVQQLSKYCDTAVKKIKMKEVTFQIVERSILTVFKLLSSKSSFIEIYNRDLSRRMLLNKEFNLQMEKDLVDAIISEIGEADESLNLRAKFRDFENSKRSFSHMSSSISEEINFSALVLEKKFWPAMPDMASDLVIPEQFQGILQNFESFYSKLDSKTNYHKLNWSNYSLHQITMSVTFQRGTKEITMSLPQGMVLMLFEDEDKIEFSRIVELIKMEDKFVRRVIASLSSQRYPILKIEGNSILFNQNFTNPKNKIRLTLGREKDSAVVEDVQNLVYQGRSSEIRSTLVRIMKECKSLPFPSLMGKAIESLKCRGTVHIQDLKKELEDLISNEYIARDPTGSTLTYIP